MGIYSKISTQLKSEGQNLEQAECELNIESHAVKELGLDSRQ